MVREFDGDPAATDSTRVLRLPGFANKRYEPDFYVQARTESTQTYHLRDFKLQFDWQDAPRHQHEEVTRKPLTQTTTLSQSEHDWAYAKRALARVTTPKKLSAESPTTAPMKNTIGNTRAPHRYEGSGGNATDQFYA